MSNNDSAMARFLFAILQQKNLKDIDWNKVASNPILSQEITNGHAARMRYSRFRSAMLGLEPQKRNRITKEKPNRVTKSKKEPRESKSKKEGSFKSESVAESGTVADSTEPAFTSTKIKYESIPPSYLHNRRTPATMSATNAATSHQVIQPRLLTPCSDTDGYPTSPAMNPSPTAEMMHSQAPYDFSMGQYGHDPTMWSHSPMFSPYASPYGFDGGHMPFEHHHAMTHHGECISTAGPGEAADDEHVSVKHEHWDNQCL